jgi:hypothetical protein
MAHCFHIVFAAAPAGNIASRLPAGCNQYKYPSVKALWHHPEKVFLARNGIRHRVVRVDDDWGQGNG